MNTDLVNVRPISELKQIYIDLYEIDEKVYGNKRHNDETIRAISIQLIPLISRIQTYKNNTINATHSSHDSYQKIFAIYENVWKTCFTIDSLFNLINSPTPPVQQKFPIKKDKQPMNPLLDTTQTDIHNILIKFGSLKEHHIQYLQDKSLFPQLHALIKRMVLIKSPTEEMLSIKNMILEFFVDEFLWVTKNAKNIPQMNSQKSQNKNFDYIERKKSEFEIQSSKLNDRWLKTQINRLSDYYEVGYVPSNEDSFFWAIAALVCPENELNGNEIVRDVLSSNSPAGLPVIARQGQIEDCKPISDFYKRTVVVLSASNYRETIFGDEYEGNGHPIILIRDEGNHWQYLKPRLSFFAMAKHSVTNCAINLLRNVIILILNMPFFIRDTFTAIQESFRELGEDYDF